MSFTKIQLPDCGPAGTLVIANHRGVLIDGARILSYRFPISKDLHFSSGGKESAHSQLVVEIFDSTTNEIELKISVTPKGDPMEADNIFTLSPRENSSVVKIKIENGELKVISRKGSDQLTLQSIPIHQLEEIRP